MQVASASLLSLSVALPLMTASRRIGGNAYSVELVCGLEENEPSGAFTPTTNRQGGFVDG